MFGSLPRSPRPDLEGVVVRTLEAAASAGLLAAAFARSGGRGGGIYFLTVAVDGEADVLGYGREGAIDVELNFGLFEDGGIDLFLRLHVLGGNGHAEGADLSELDGIALGEFALEVVGESVDGVAHIACGQGGHLCNVFDDVLVLDYSGFVHLGIVHGLAFVLADLHDLALD